MTETTSLIVVCIIIEVYLILIGIISVFEMYCYYKDGNRKGTNLKGRTLRKAIRHELVHARIANRFGFIDWKIINKADGLACKIDIDYDVMNWKSIFNFLIMCCFHFIFDIGHCIIWVAIMSVCEYIKKYFIDVKTIIEKFKKVEITTGSERIG